MQWSVGIFLEMALEKIKKIKETLISFRIRFTDSMALFFAVADEIEGVECKKGWRRAILFHVGRHRQAAFFASGAKRP